MADTSAAERPAMEGRSSVLGALRITAIITLAAIVVQFALAGYGTFSRQNHNVGDGYFEPHQTLGYIILLLELIMLILAIVARRGMVLVGPALGGTVLAILQPVWAGLGDSNNGWWGALHVLGGLAIAGATSTVLARARG